MKPVKCVKLDKCQSIECVPHQLLINNVTVKDNDSNSCHSVKSDVLWQITSDSLPLTSEKSSGDEANLFRQSGRSISFLGITSITKTYSISEELSQRCLESRQCRPSLWYRLVFSASKVFSIAFRVLLLRQITGQREQPQVHKQKQQPQRSHRADTGSVFLRTVFTRPTEPVNSSGANLPVNALGKSRQKRLLRPNTVMLPAPLIITGSGVCV